MGGQNMLQMANIDSGPILAIAVTNLPLEGTIFHDFSASLHLLQAQALCGSDTTL